MNVVVKGFLIHFRQSFVKCVVAATVSSYITEVTEVSFLFVISQCLATRFIISDKDIFVEQPKVEI